VSEALTAFLRALPPVGSGKVASSAADDLFRQANEWFAHETVRPCPRRFGSHPPIGWRAPISRD
jgi:hypothetical protein